MVSVNCESAKEMPRLRLFDKKFSLFKEVAIFSIIRFKVMSYWFCEIMQFSGMFGMEATEWSIWTVNLQKKWPENIYLTKKLSLFKEVAIFSLIPFNLRSYWYCEMIQFSGIFGIEGTEWVVWTRNWMARIRLLVVWTRNLQKKWPEYVYWKKNVFI